ncbi:MAG: peptidase M14, partial [Mesorhizobium sp.]
DLIGILHSLDSLSAGSIGIRAPETSIVLAVASGAHVDANKVVALVARPLKK